MKIYFSKSEAVIDLHERGFTEDFQLLGNSILWIQGQIFIRQKDFSIAECHSFIDSLGKETIIFGITANGFFANGILINHYKSYTDKTPAIIQDKLKKGASGFLNTEGNYLDVSFTR
jgi:hypothetical protein